MLEVISGTAILFELLRRLILFDHHDPYMAYCKGAILCPEIRFFVVHIFSCSLELYCSYLKTFPHKSDMQGNKNACTIWLIWNVWCLILNQNECRVICIDNLKWICNYCCCSSILYYEYIISIWGCFHGSKLTICSSNNKF